MNCITVNFIVFLLCECVNTWEGARCPARITLALAQRPTHITTYEEDEEGPGKLDLKTSGPE